MKMPQLCYLFTFVQTVLPVHIYSEFKPTPVPTCKWGVALLPHPTVCLWTWTIIWTMRIFRRGFASTASSVFFHQSSQVVMHCQTHFFDNHVPGTWTVCCLRRHQVARLNSLLISLFLMFFVIGWR